MQQTLLSSIIANPARISARDTGFRAYVHGSIAISKLIGLPLPSPPLRGSLVVSPREVAFRWKIAKKRREERRNVVAKRGGGERGKEGAREKGRKKEKRDNYGKTGSSRAFDRLTNSRNKRAILDVCAYSR